MSFIIEKRDIAQAVVHPPVKILIIRSTLHSGCICSLGYFPFRPVVHQWLWYVLSYLLESAYKTSLAAYQKEWPMW